jgi:peroxiredoxin
MPEMPQKQPVKIGSFAPNFSLIATNGQTQTLESTLGFEGLILLFFSTCFLKTDREQLQRYGHTHNQATSSNLPVVGISGTNWETLHQLHHQLQLPFPLLFDPCCRVSKRYQAMWIPKFVTGRVIYTLNKQGIILSRHSF